MRVIIRGNWDNCVGTGYCDALGIYDSLDQAAEDAHCYASERWAPYDRGCNYEDEEECDQWEIEGPDYYVEEYDPEVHDMQRSGGGSFDDEFKWMENNQ